MSTFLSAYVDDATPLIEALEREEEDIFRSMLYLRVRLGSVAMECSPVGVRRIAADVEELVREVKYAPYFGDCVVEMMPFVRGQFCADGLSVNLPILRAGRAYSHVCVWQC